MPGPLTETSWLIDPGIAYLNHGGFGALPRPVADAAAALRAEVEADPTDVFMRRWIDLVDGVRARVAAFLRSDADDLVFVPNATTGTATVLACFPLSAGDEVVTTDHRYPAVAAQVSVLAERGVRVIETPVPLDVATADDIVGRILAAVTPRTKLIVVDQIASPTGFVFPVTQIVAACHDAGLPVLVDAAHAPGQLDVDLRAIDADFWVGNLHKWVCSPRARAATCRTTVATAHSSVGSVPRLPRGLPTRVRLDRNVRSDPAPRHPGRPRLLGRARLGGGTTTPT